MNAKQAIATARKYATGNASATVCLQDAISCQERGLDTYAIRRAADSLAYSVGIFHDAYRAVKAAV